MTVDDILRFTLSLDFWLEGQRGGWRTYDEDELRVLAACALAACRPGGYMIEIGVYMGWSASVLLQVARERDATVYLVDPMYWQPELAEPQLRGLLAQFPTTRWRWYPATSAEAARVIAPSYSMFDLVHIDGDHGLPSVAEDCDLWVSCVCPGGMAVWHDCQLGDPESKLRGELAAEKTPGWETVAHRGRNGVLARRRPA